MIVIDLRNLRDQIVLTKNMETAIGFLEQDGVLDLPDGRVEIDGDQVFALVQSYSTFPREEVSFEGHKRYIDIQYVGLGNEIIAWADINDATITQPYDETSDVWFGTANPDKSTDVRLSAGQLAVLYPVDAHTPRIADGDSTPVKKIVVKVAV